MTVITIVLIAIVLGVGTIIVNNLMDSTAKKSACSEIGGTLTGNNCEVITGGGTTTTYTCSKSDGKWSCGTKAS